MRVCSKGGFGLFVHGIPFRYVPFHYPVLNAAYMAPERTREQIEDAQHLIKQFGFEPVHFLRTSDYYPLNVCMKECFRFGDTLLIFNTLPYPRLQLSANEWGVHGIDMRDAYFVISRHPEAHVWFRQHMPETPFFHFPFSLQEQA